MALQASAVLISLGDGTSNTTSLGFEGFDYVGEVDSESATYLGDGWVITANHVGAGDFVLDGIVYPWLPGHEVRLDSNATTPADLIMFPLALPHPELPPLLIRSTPPGLNQFLILIGHGRDRGPSIVFDPNGPFPPPPDPLDGWSWGATSSKRWGTNEIAAFTSGLILGTVSFYTEFDAGEVLPEAQATIGDSGGAVFSLGPEGTQLAGIIYAVGPLPGQPANTSVFTNLTFIARLDYYSDQIEPLRAVPEPRTALPFGLLLLQLLAMRQRGRKLRRGPLCDPDPAD